MGRTYAKAFERDVTWKVERNTEDEFVLLRGQAGHSWEIVAEYPEAVWISDVANELRDDPCGMGEETLLSMCKQLEDAEED